MKSTTLKPGSSRQVTASAIVLFSALIAASDLVGQTLANHVLSGTVRNQTQERAAGGIEVVLLRLQNGMQEEARTLTDSRGNFRFESAASGATHLLRVTYQSVNYYKQVADDDPLQIDVFDASSEVNRVRGTAEIVRIGNNGNDLHVAEMYEIENASSPPVTQIGDHAFQFFLPPNAKLDSALAAAPGGMAVLASAHLVQTAEGRWAVDFPLRPGATKFGVNYDLPYAGHVRFAPRIAYPTRQLAVMIPSTMRFSSIDTAFHSLQTGAGDFQVEAMNDARPGEVPSFEISGNGTLPLLAAKQELPSTMKRSSSATPTPTSTLSFSIAQTIPVIFIAAISATGLLLFYRFAGGTKRALQAAKPSVRPARSESTGLEIVKQQLFELEVSRLRGSITAEEYGSMKHSLEQAIASNPAKRC